MPNYEYRCQKCEHTFELWQEVGAEAPPCEECGAEVKKVFHPVRTIFKGSGFYITDTRAEQKSSSKAKSKQESGSKDKSADSTSDSSSKDSSSKTTEKSSSDSSSKTESKKEKTPAK